MCRCSLHSACGANWTSATPAVAAVILFALVGKNCCRKLQLVSVGVYFDSHFSFVGFTWTCHPEPGAKQQAATNNQQPGLTQQAGKSTPDRKQLVTFSREATQAVSEEASALNTQHSAPSTGRPEKATKGPCMAVPALNTRLSVT